MTGRSIFGDEAVEATLPVKGPRSQFGDESPDDEGGGGIGRVILQTFWGANEQLQNLLNAPAAVGELALGEGTLPKFRLETGQSFSGGGEPKSAAERIARRIGTEIGASLPYAAMPYALPAARAGAGAAERAVGALGQATRGAPVKTAVAEAISATGAGLGAGVAQEVAPGSTGAEIGGQIIGGVLAPVVSMWSPTALAIRAGRAAATRLSARASQERARQFIGEKYAGDMRGLGPELEQAERLGQEIPGFKPSLGEATGAQSFIATQRQLESALSGPALDQAIARRRANLAAIAGEAQKRAPGKPASPQFIVDDAAGTMTALSDDVSTAVSRVEELRRTVAGDIPRARKDELGKDIRENIRQKQIETQGYFQRRKAELGLDRADVTADGQKFADEVTGAIEPLGLFAGPDVPESYRRIKALGLGVGEGEAPITITFDDMWQLRSQIERDIRTVRSSRQANKDTILLGLHKMEESLDQFLQTVGEGTPLVENFRTFRQEYLVDYVQRFKQGAVRRVMGRTPEGDYLVRDENVAATFFGKNQITPVKQYVSVFRDEPAKMAALETAALDDFASKAVVDGVIDAKKAEAWFRDHEAVLREMPGTYQKTFQDRTARNLVLRDRQMELTARREQIESTMLGREVRQFRAGKTAEEVLDRAMKNPALLDEMMAALSPQGKAALKRHVWDYALANGERSLRPDTLVKVLGKQHYDDLVDFFGARRMVERVPAPTGAADKPAVLAGLERAIGIGLPQLASRMFAFQTGRASKAWMTTELVQRFLRGRSIAEQEHLFTTALYDPEIARGLASLVYAKGETPSLRDRFYMATVKKLNTRLFTLGIGTRSEQEDR